MTQDEIIEMARQVGFDVKEWGDETLVRTVHSKGYFVVINQKLEAFAKLVAAKEREACANVCDDIEVEETHYCMNVYEEGTRYKFAVIEAIRARGEA